LKCNDIEKNLKLKTEVIQLYIHPFNGAYAGYMDTISVISYFLGVSVFFSGS